MSELAHSEERADGKRPETLSHIYVLTSGRRIKVGIARDLLKRVQALSAGAPGLLGIGGWRLVRTAVARSLEAAVHRRLRPYAIGREWFEGISYREALAVIDEVILGQPPLDPAAVAALEALSAAECHRRMVKYMDRATA